jgi:hypothetical protein
VAFYSEAANLVSGDTNGSADIFVHDRQTGATTRVSVDSAGNQGNSHSYYPAISADGRYVAFSSDASNLVLGDTNGIRDVFVHDRLAATVPGDSNGDGLVSMVDAMLIAQYVAGLIGSGALDLTAANVNCDGIVTMIDPMLIAQKVAGLISEFPACSP